MSADPRRLTHVGLNAVFLQPQMGGIETYVRSLLPALAEARPGLRISVFLNTHGRELLASEPWAGSIELVTHPLLGRRYTRALTELTLLGSLATRRGIDVIHSVAMTAPLRTRAANVVTVADTIWLRHPDPADRIAFVLWRALIPRLARRADRVIAYSEAARREISEDLGVPVSRIDAIPLGPGADVTAAPLSEEEVRERFALGPGPIVLAVSALKAHKNVEVLVDALPRLRETHAGLTLVVPANPSARGQELEARAQTLGVGDALVLTGWVEPAVLEGLYRTAACIAFPSLQEGFGLPVLEAMRRRVPVACSTAPAVVEVAGDAAVRFDPGSAEAAADAIGRILADPVLAEDLRKRGVSRAAEFTWKRTAERTLESYERARAARDAAG